MGHERPGTLLSEPIPSRASVAGYTPYPQSMLVVWQLSHHTYSHATNVLLSYYQEELREQRPNLQAPEEFLALMSDVVVSWPLIEDTPHTYVLLPWAFKKHDTMVHVLWYNLEIHSDIVVLRRNNLKEDWTLEFNVKDL